MGARGMSKHMIRTYAIMVSKPDVETLMERGIVAAAQTMLNTG
jgi:hypothetical protein